MGYIIRKIKKVFPNESIVEDSYCKLNSDLLNYFLSEKNQISIFFVSDMQDLHRVLGGISLGLDNGLVKPGSYFSIETNIDDFEKILNKCGITLKKSNGGTKDSYVNNFHYDICPKTILDINSLYDIIFKKDFIGKFEVISISSTKIIKEYLSLYKNFSPEINWVEVSTKNKNALEKFTTNADILKDQTT